MQNTVEQLEDGIIYVQKIGEQTEQALVQLYEKIGKISGELRAQNKPVLILTNGQQEGGMDSQARKMAVKIGMELDYDKSASFGSIRYVQGIRKILSTGAGLNQKVATFETREEAMVWLLR